MKKQHKPIIICIYGVILAVFINCTSTASNTETETPVSFFTGSGGRGMRLGIIVPQSQGLNENQAYLPDMVQGVLVSNIAKYSAISVLDRVSLDRVIAETLDPTYEDNLDIVRLGHVTQVGYMMTGNIIRTSTGFSLQINVTDTTPNTNTIASHSGTYTVTQFDNHSAIRNASLDLLTQMGVKLTNTAKNELIRASPQQEINGQTEMAQGIIAQRKGQTVEAVLHYFNASELESISTEALSRMSVATTTIATGSLGDQIRNDIQRRNEWVRLIEETRKFFVNSPLYNLAELHFNPKLDIASINYIDETAQLSFPVQIRLNNERLQAVKKILNDINNGLEATGRREQWGLNVVIDPFVYAYMFDFVLVNEKGKVISSASSPHAILLFYTGKPSDEISLFSGAVADFAGVSDKRLSGSPWNTYEFLSVRRGGSSYHYYFSPNLSYRIVTTSDYRRLSDNAVLVPRNEGERGHDSTTLLLNPKRSGNFNVAGSNVPTGFPTWHNDPQFTVKAIEIDDNLSIRLKNVTIYRFSPVLYWENNSRNGVQGRFRLFKQGNNIISVKTEI